MLSTELKDLELNGFVRRTVFTGTPVVVEYELTEYAETLGAVLQALNEWACKAQRDGKEEYAFERGNFLTHVCNWQSFLLRAFVLLSNIVT